MSEDNNDENLDGQTFPLPDDLTFKTLVESSIELADKIGDILHGQEQVLAICSLVLVMRKGLEQAKEQMISSLITEDDIGTTKVITDILAHAVLAEEELGKFLLLYPSLRIGSGYKEQVTEYFKDEDGDDPKKRKDTIEIPDSNQMEELYDKLFTPRKGDDE